MPATCSAPLASPILLRTESLLCSTLHTAHSHTLFRVHTPARVGSMLCCPLSFRAESMLGTLHTPLRVHTPFRVENMLCCTPFRAESTLCSTLCILHTPFRVHITALCANHRLVCVSPPCVHFTHRGSHSPRLTHYLACTSLAGVRFTHRVPLTAAHSLPCVHITGWCTFHSLCFTHRDTFTVFHSPGAPCVQLINGMRVVKFYAWERPFVQIASKYRSQEATILWKIAKLQGVFGMVLFSGEALPCLCSMLCCVMCSVLVQRSVACS